MNLAFLAATPFAPHHPLRRTVFPSLQQSRPQACARPSRAPRKRVRAPGPLPRRGASADRKPSTGRKPGATQRRRRDDEGPADLALSSQERLPKVLARLGVASRRGADALIAEGRVTVNGERPTHPGQPVDVRTDELAVDGAVVSGAASAATNVAPVWLALHKPRGYLCDIAGARSLAALPRAARAIQSDSLVPVGRLPELAAGLVIFTNERGCVPELANPANLHVKEWSVDVRGRPSRQQFDAIAKQVVEAGTQVGSIGADGMGRYTQIIIRLRDGRHHGIQRLVEHAGMDMLRMTRLSFGPVALGSLKAGSFRFLKAKEIKALKRGVLEHNIA